MKIKENSETCIAPEFDLFITKIIVLKYQLNENRKNL
jgi:hypothetical protein